ncbi:MAG: hypothetical protein ACE5HA_03080 [Anaerolineae bacterium]
MGCTGHPDGTMNLDAVNHARVAIAWNTNPSDAHYANEPLTNLDLEVKDPYGKVIAGSYSFDNTH